jgi:hypothetical protein
MRLARLPKVLCFGAVLWAAAASAQAREAGPAPAVYADALRPSAARPAGALLNKSDLAEGKAQWSAFNEIKIGAEGASPATVSAAHVAIPATAGTIRVQADLSAKGTAFTGLALGRGDLSHDFWTNLTVMLTVMADGRYNVFAAKKNLIDNPAPAPPPTEGASHVEMSLDTIARTVTVQINGRTVTDALALPKELPLENITAAGFRFHEPVTAGVPFLRNFKVELIRQAATGLEPVDLAMCFTTPDAPSTLRWRVASPGPGQEVPYVIHDYAGNRIDAGNATQGEDGTVVLERKFPRGWFEVSFPAANQTFGVVSLEPHAGPADPFFCIDAGLTWLEQNRARRDELVRIMARSGLAVVRERTDSVFTAKVGTYNWEGGKGGESTRKLYADHHLKILEILGAGAGNFGMVKGQPFPQKLGVMADEWAAVARHYDHVWGGAEVYNESDLRTVSADQYVPMVKALSYALARAKCEAPLVTGVFATIPPGSYFDTCAANGMLADSDVVSFHSYDKPVDIEQIVVRYREWLKKSGKEALPLWHTECGKSWTLGLSRPPVAEDATSAMEIAAMGIETKACGVARYYPFVLVYYEEGLKNFGMMGREATPLRSLAAYVQSVRALSGQSYLGDLQMSDPAVKLSRVFGSKPAGDAVVTVYTGKLDPKTTVAFPVAYQRVAGADGRDLPRLEGKIPLPDGLGYVWVKASDLGPALKTETRAAQLTKLGAAPPAPPRLASPVILQFLAQDMPAQGSARRYLITRETERDLPLTVRIHNLSPSALQVTPELTVPGGRPQAKDPVPVPAMGSADVAWKPDCTTALDIAETRFVTVTARSSGDVQPSPLAIPLTMEGTIEQHLARHARKTPLPITELTRWQANMGSGRSKFSATPEGGWRVDLAFGAKQGNWAYPRFSLPRPLEPAVERGFLLRARTLQGGRPAIIAKPAAGTSFWAPEIFPGDGAWHVVYIPFDEFKPGPGGVGNQNSRLDPASWRVLEIGMGSNTQENGMEISHFMVVGE